MNEEAKHDASDAHGQYDVDKGKRFTFLSHDLLSSLFATLITQVMNQQLR
ncbi:hypothetical protein [Oleiphilus sp. HI0123]|nr:hypothetical protein [Oleiphilus sp. HI0123]